MFETGKGKPKKGVKQKVVKIYLKINQTLVNIYQAIPTIAVVP
jgi:hypothetical protein